MSFSVFSEETGRLAPPVPEPSSAVALRERAAAVLWIRTQMVRHGVTPEHLVAAGCFAPRMRAARPAAPRYRSADGQSWDGEGAMPDWLRRAVDAGQMAEHFQVKG
ncbi:hypothetical protein ACU4GI_46250 (plasmid) [Cupriavidus basilensis]